jgi:hypothetical protein
MRGVGGGGGGGGGGVGRGGESRNKGYHQAYEIKVHYGITIFIDYNLVG